jgi:hypothetical protein
MIGRELAVLVPDSFPFWLGTIAAHPKPVSKAKSARTHDARRASRLSYDGLARLPCRYP